MFNRQLTG